MCPCPHDHCRSNNTVNSFIISRETPGVPFKYYSRNLRILFYINILFQCVFFSLCCRIFSLSFLHYFFIFRLPEIQQKVGGFFLNLMPQMKALYVSYCSNHPCAVNVLTQHRYVNTGDTQRPRSKHCPSSCVTEVLMYSM